MSTFKEITIDGLTIEQYCNDPARVRRDAIAAGIKGEPYTHYHTTKGRLNGRTTIKHKPLDNLDLWLYACSKYRNEFNSRMNQCTQCDGPTKTENDKRLCSTFGET